MMKIFLFISVLFLGSICSAAILTVDDNNPADYDKIQDAINDANNGDEIIVSPGTYNENINIPGKNIILRSTDAEDEDVVAATTIRGCEEDSWGVAPVVTFGGTESENCRISGFTLTNGRGANMGGGILGNGTMATIEYNIIYGNQAKSIYYPSSGYGGGLYGCDGLIQYNTVYENQATCDEGTARGGGLYGCDGVIQHNIIYNNSATGFGGHLGGGLCSCQGTIENNTIFGNEAHYGGGLYDCNGTIRNCIVWGNTADQLYECYAGVTYSDIEGGWKGEGNIDVDPLFADANNNDFHLKSQAGRWDPNIKRWVKDSNTSQCIDAGDPNSDWRRELWPHGRRIDMGCHGGTPHASRSPSTLCSIADLDKDCDVDFNDLKLFTEKWLVQQVLLDADLDRNGDVNFVDFAIFGNEWFN